MRRKASYTAQGEQSAREWEAFHERCKVGEKERRKIMSQRDDNRVVSESKK